MLEEVEGEEAAPTATQWEYLLLADRGRMHKVSLDELNEVGRQGWELINIVHEERTQTPEIHFYFKRPAI